MHSGCCLKDETPYQATFTNKTFVLSYKQHGRVQGGAVGGNVLEVRDTAAHSPPANMVWLRSHAANTVRAWELLPCRRPGFFVI